MIPTWILVVTCIAIALICLGIGTNASMKTTGRSSKLALKFGFFMAISHFCFYYIGIFATKLFLDLNYGMKNAVIVVIMLTMAVKTLWNVFSYKPENNFYVISKMPIILYLSFANGLNGLLVGIALTLSGALHLNTALLISLGAFLGSFTGAGFSPHIASIINRTKPATISAILFLILAIFYFLRYSGKI
ncbi:MAG: manganese efflux pump [Bacteroidales bacterium]|jgi:putative Mn2+ efflux pump MntP|nr:manganese efflux pump [Bacteroidales bacterium]